ncbi:unnamed protein product, partial [Mesorhabditis belari]|uniref:Amidohydrolase-related domain-containing protein n=1 Tax=Mesorhabditis belari TaxID=2138241 RepID=A0AAF3JAA2_9BILA
MISLSNSIICPKLVWIGDKFQEGISIRIDSDGNIAEIGKGICGTDKVIWSNEALIPGFVNTHSHAFHRHLRGRSEIGDESGDTFWRWRDNMYGLVDEIDWETMKRLCKSTFQEMINAGITTVGEFHYVHHGEKRFDLDSAVIEAAREAGIRMCLLTTLYQRAGFDTPTPHPIQKKRFISDYDEFLSHVRSLKALENETISIGVAAHSARAVPFEKITSLWEWANDERVPFHIHLEEQPKECVDCQKYLGTKETPMDLILKSIVPNQLFTGVHNTYTSEENMSKLAKLGANVSICPCTEGYLGDGIPKISTKTHLSFGTDCNNRICFLEEIRWAAFTQHVKHNSRNVAGLSASRLMHYATIGGARSLNLEDKVGSFELGKAFDFVSFSLNSPLLDGLQSDELIDGIVFSTGNREISKVGVQGKLLVDSK